MSLLEKLIKIIKKEEEDIVDEFDDQYDDDQGYTMYCLQ